MDKKIVVFGRSSASVIRYYKKVKQEYGGNELGIIGDNPTNTSLGKALREQLRTGLESEVSDYDEFDVIFKNLPEGVEVLKANTVGECIGI